MVKTVDIWNYKTWNLGVFKVKSGVLKHPDPARVLKSLPFSTPVVAPPDRRTTPRFAPELFEGGPWRVGFLKLSPGLGTTRGSAVRLEPGSDGKWYDAVIRASGAQPALGAPSSAHYHTWRRSSNCRDATSWLASCSSGCTKNTRGTYVVFQIRVRYGFRYGALGQTSRVQSARWFPRFSAWNFQMPTRRKWLLSQNRHCY